MKITDLKATELNIETAHDDTLFMNVEQEPFRVLGVFKGDDGIYHRMPKEVAEKVSPAGF